MINLYLCSKKTGLTIMKQAYILTALMLLIYAGAAAQTYIVNDTTESSIEYISLSGLPTELTIDIPDGKHPDQLTFSSKTASFLGISGMGEVILSEMVNGTWAEVTRVTPTTEYQAFGPYTLNPRAKQIKFSVEFGATCAKYIRDIRITEYTGEIIAEQQTITWEQYLDNLTVGSETELTATASSGLAVIYESSDSTVCDLRGSTLIARAEGMAVITATQPGDDFYDSAPGISTYATVRLPSSLPVTMPAAALTAYPNPVKDMLNICGAPIHAVSIYSMSGQLMLSITTDGGDSQQIDCSALPDGIYIMNVVSDSAAHQLHIIKLTR